MKIRTSISPSSVVELNTTSALANYATEAGIEPGTLISIEKHATDSDKVWDNLRVVLYGRAMSRVSYV
uniref:Uncharacterized protein n=1 Tax=Timema douglasi TaxID=61478 RepID=A0A7R8ZD21_TIMDO|nr:unnamed protein product [Timema douglasi]